MNDLGSRCVIGTREHGAHVGLLCEGHLQRLSTMLRDIEDEAAMLSAVPSMQIRSGSGKGSLPSERTPVRLEVVAFRDPRTRRWEPEPVAAYVPPAPKAYGPWCLFCDHETCTAWRAGRRRDLHDDEYDAGSARLASILDELHNWARLVREERDLAAPDQVTVVGERMLLTRSLEWCAEQAWIDEMYGDLRTLLGQLRNINGTAPEKPVGRCYLPAEDGTCGGTIRRATGTGLPWVTLDDRCTRKLVETADGQAYCDTCDATWSGPQLAMLNYELERAKRPKDDRGEPLWTAEEVAREHGVKPGTINVWAHRRRIESVGGYWDPRAFRRKATA